MIIHAKTGEPAFNPISHVLKTGKTLKLANDTMLIARDGKKYQIADSAAPIHDSGGKITGAVMVFSDVTEQYRARQALKETTQRLEFILRATQTGVDIIDEDFNLQYVDTLWQGVYGAFKGRKCYEYFKNLQRPCENCGAPRALETRQVTLSEQILPREGNRVVSCHSVPFQNEQGRWLVAEFKTDITRHKHLEEKLKFQLRFEQMVSSIASSFVGLAPEKIDETINRSLRLIGEFFSIDRSTVFQFSPVEDVYENTHIWCAPGVEPLRGILKHISAKELPWLCAQIQQMAPVHIPDVRKLPPEAVAERTEFLSQGSQSLLFLPLSIKTVGYANGFYALGSIKGKRTWTEEEISLLNILARGLAGALTRRQINAERERAERALQESEENLSITLHSIGDGVITTDLGGLIMRMNPRAEELTGWPLKEAAGRPLEEVFRIINVKTGEPAFNPVHHVINTGGAVKMANDTALIARDGSVRQIGDSAAPIHDNAGKIAGAVMVFSDVTEQYRARKALQESEARYRSIVENINDGLFIYDFAEKIIDCNEIAHRMLGYERDELLGTNLAQIRSSEESGRASRRMEQLTRANKLLFEGTLIHKNGTPIPVEVSLKVVTRDGNGLIQAFSRDITGRKQAQQQIASYTSELEALYRKLEEEMNKARQVHERTLPKELPAVEGVSLAAHYQPAEKLGGDFYDVVRLDNKLVIYLSDVTGHGADGAMLSVFVKHAIRSYLYFSPEKGIRPGIILRHLSAQFQQENLPEEYFICIFLAVLDLESRELTYTAAGFQDAPLVRLGNGERLQLISKGLFLSPAFPGELLNLQEKSIRLTPGSTVFFNTDGLSEQGVDGTYYGMRLPEIFYKCSHLPPQQIVRVIREDFKKCNGGSLQGNDDITFLVLQLDPNPKRAERLELNSDFTELDHLREQVTDLLDDSKEADLFWACLHELACNAMEHGNQLKRDKTVSVELVITKQYMQGSVEDQGVGFNWREQTGRPLDLEGLTERGRGIAMVRICSDQLLFNDKGNRATFIIKSLKEENSCAN